jgi:hypothetical protein
MIAASLDYELSIEKIMDDPEHVTIANCYRYLHNSVNIFLLRLLKADDDICEVEIIYGLDGAPVLNIKPYITDYYLCKNAQIIWYNRCSYR